MIAFLRRKKVPPIIMDAEQADTSAMAALHNGAFARGWSDGEFTNLMGDKHVMGLVARRGDSTRQEPPIGFILIRHVLDEAEILTIAVSPSVRRGGVGFALIDEAMRRLYALRIAALFLEVEVGNQAAIGLYYKMGFKKVGQRDNYYAETGAITGNGPSAALVMRRDLR